MPKHDWVLRVLGYVANMDREENLTRSDTAAFGGGKAEYVTPVDKQTRAEDSELLNQEEEPVF